MIYSECTAIIYTAIQLAAILPKYGVSSLNAPIQVDSTYANCAYNIGFLQFVLTVTGMRILGCWFAFALAACFALIFNNLIVSAAVSGGICAILLLMYEHTLTLHGETEISASKFYLHHNLLKFSPIGLLILNEYLVSSDYVNVFGFPVTELFFNLAVTIMNKFKLAIFDEPTAGLDPKERVRFREILRELSGDVVIILSTHIVSDVEMLANNIILLKDGNVCENDTAEELEQKYSSEKSENRSALESVYMNFFGEGEI